MFERLVRPDDADLLIAHLNPIGNASDEKLLHASIAIKQRGCCPINSSSLPRRSRRLNICFPPASAPCA